MTPTQRLALRENLEIGYAALVADEGGEYVRASELDAKDARIAELERRCRDRAEEIEIAEARIAELERERDLLRGWLASLFPLGLLHPDPSAVS